MHIMSMGFMAIYTLRTTGGKEDIVTDMMFSKIKAENLDVRAVVHPAELKGYIFIEGRVGEIHKAIMGMLHVRGLIEKPVRMEEIEHFLETKKARIVINKEDTVEIIGGPFKGEKGKIQRIDKAKDEVTVELLEASVPIPVTIATEFVKLTKRAKPVEPEEKEEEKPKVSLPSAEELREAEDRKADEAAEGEAKAEEEKESVLPSAEEIREEVEEPEEKPEKKPEEPKEEKPAEEEKPEEPAAPEAPKPEEPEKPKEETPKDKDEPVVFESEEMLEKKILPAEPEAEKKEEPDEEDSILSELEKEEKKKSSKEDISPPEVEKKKKKSLEDLEEGG